jgi:hypothetical protein
MGESTANVPPAENVPLGATLIVLALSLVAIGMPFVFISNIRDT